MAGMSEHGHAREPHWTPVRVWNALDDATRRLAAESLYADAAGRREGDLAIAQALRFREQAVKKLPVAQRVAYVLKAVRGDDNVASSLLLALHLQQRAPLLEAFLGELGIPNDGGMIDEEFDLEPPSAEALGKAVERVRADFPAEHVRVYLQSLVALDGVTWAGLAELAAEA